MNAEQGNRPASVYVRDCRPLKNGRYLYTLSCGDRVYANYPANAGDSRTCDVCTNRGGNR